MDSLGQLVDDLDWFVKFNERIYLVTKDDRVYTYGNQTWDQNMFDLGYSEKENETEPTEIFELANKHIVKFASSNRHMLALSAKGSVWAWGSNKYGQLGDGSTDNHIAPVRVERITQAMDIVASVRTSFVLTRGGHVLAWGDNTNGECGNDYINFEWKPVRVPLDQEIARLDTTYFGTSVATTVHSQLYVWGYNVASSSPTLLPYLPKAVATTRHRYYILTEVGNIWRSGRHRSDDLELFYRGDIQFEALYAEQQSIALPIARSIDGQLWGWTRDGSNDPPRPLNTTNIRALLSSFRVDVPSW